MSFERAVAFVLRQEGGESTDPHDAGGHTKYGISQRAYPDEDIASLTVERATLIYKRDYWDAARCEQMPWPVALAVLDMAVNAGVRVAIRCLQRAVDVKDDGEWGAMSQLALERSDPLKVARDFAVERIRYYAAISGWIRYSQAWTKRTIDAVVAGVSG